MSSYTQPIPRYANLIIFERTTKTLQTIRLIENMNFGRGTQNDIAVVSCIVSKMHGGFICEGGKYYFEDFNSYNGTYINGEKTEPLTLIELRNGDILKIGCKSSDGPHSNAVLMIFTTDLLSWEKFTPDKEKVTTIGRAEKNDIQLDNIMVAGSHAMIFFECGKWFISDNFSTNGVKLNGKAVHERAVLKCLDIVKIADSILVMLDDEIIYEKYKAVAI